jgi:hypothetical protein
MALSLACFSVERLSLVFLIRRIGSTGTTARSRVAIRRVLSLLSGWAEEKKVELRWRKSVAGWINVTSAAFLDALQGHVRPRIRAGVSS